MGDELKVVRSVGSEAEANIVVSRLREDGIEAIDKGGAIADAYRGAGPRDVYVSEKDLDRARELLKDDENAFTDEELARLSEQAGREAEERD
jgi:hypothetical protein